MAAVIVNLAPAPYTLDAGAAAGYGSYVQISASDATVAVNKASVLSRSAGRLPAGGLALPAYSVTHLYG